MRQVRYLVLKLVYEAGIYLILLWVPTRMVLCHLVIVLQPGRFTIPVLILGASLYFSPTLDCTNSFKKFSPFPK